VRRPGSGTSKRERVEEEDVPRTNPTALLIRLKILVMRSWARVKTDWMALRMVLRRARMMSKKELRRLPIASVMEAMVAFSYGTLLRGSVIGMEFACVLRGFESRRRNGSW